MAKEIIIKEHDNCLQANELSRSIYSCSVIARKVIAFAASKLQEQEIGVKKTLIPVAKFRISEFLKALGLTDSGENYELIKKATRELRHCYVEIRENGSDDEFQIWNWFQFIKFSKTQDKIELHFSDKIGWALLDLRDNYCSLDLKTIGGLKSFYAFRFYEIALSWQGMKGKNGNPPGCWWFFLSEDEIRTTFRMSPFVYEGRTNNFIANVIEKPIDELNSICKEFRIDVSRVKRGRNILGYRFDCCEIIEERKKIAKSTPKAERKQIREINDEYKELELYALQYPEEWAAALEQATIEGQAMRPPRMGVLNEYRAMEILQAQGLSLN